MNYYVKYVFSMSGPLFMEWPIIHVTKSRGNINKCYDQTQNSMSFCSFFPLTFHDVSHDDFHFPVFQIISLRILHNINPSKGVGNPNLDHQCQGLIIIASQVDMWTFVNELCFMVSYEVS